MSELPYAAFDADNHYYEALDAFTRYVDPKMQPRCVQWCEVNGRKYHVVGGIVSHAVVNPTFDPVAKAGAMHDYFRGNPNKLQPYEFLREREPIPAEYRDRDARIAKLDEFGLEAVWLFPTLGILYEELIKHDIEAVTTLFTAFNRWLDDDWGLDYQGRIFASPYITLADLDWAIRELEWAIDHGARHVVMRPAAPHTAVGPGPGERSAQRPVLGARQRGRHHGRGARGRQRLLEQRLRGRRVRGRLQRQRPVGAVGQGVPHRTRRVRLPDHARVRQVVRALPERAGRVGRERRRVPRRPVPQAASTDHKMPGYFTEDPVEAFKRNVWINPFWEDDVNTVVEHMGADRVIFGSDWPHIEGMPRPLDYAVEVKHFDDASRQRIMRDNARELTARRAPR